MPFAIQDVRKNAGTKTSNQPRPKTQQEEEEEAFSRTLVGKSKTAEGQNRRIVERQKGTRVSDAKKWKSLSHLEALLLAMLSHRLPILG